MLSKSVTAFGGTVRLYTRPGSPFLWAEQWERGRKVRWSLKHTDLRRAEREALARLDALQSRPAGSDTPWTLSALAEAYRASPAHTGRTAKTRREAGVTLDRLVAWFGPGTVAAHLTHNQFRSYHQDRMAGRHQPEGFTHAPVAPRTATRDLQTLRTLLRWAHTERRGGQRLLPDNPWEGYTLPSEALVPRPVLSHPDFCTLLAHAAPVHPLLPAMLLLADSTGRRPRAWRHLRWDHVDFAAETLTWPRATDKQGFTQCLPAAPEVFRALALLPRPSPWVFPCPSDPSRPVTKDRAAAWFRKAAAAAGLTLPPRGAWYMLRRKWASERKGMPLTDVAEAGGWKTTETLLRYMQSDPDTRAAVILTPSRRLQRTG